MPLRLPNELAIHPSPSLVVASPSSPTAQGNRPTCGICHDKSASYTCPTCNVSYCSLACFKDENRHGGCLSSFTKKTEQDARDFAKKDAGDEVEERAKSEERRKVLDMLRRMQVKDLDGGSITDLFLQSMDDDDNDNGNEVDETTAATSIQERDLPSSTAELLGMLSPEQRRVFLEAVQTDRRQRTSKGQSSHSRSSQGDRASRLWDKVRQADEVGPDERSHSEAETSAPSSSGHLWWQQRAGADSSFKGSASFKAKVRDLVSRSEAAQKPVDQIPPGIAWNTFALLLAYTYTLLYLDIPSLESLFRDSEAEEAATTLIAAVELLLRLAPFLLPPASPSKTYAAFASADHSTLGLRGPNAVTLFLIERLGEEHRSAQPSRLMLELYSQTVPVLGCSSIESSKISIAEGPAKQPHTCLIEEALGDIFQLLDTVAHETKLVGPILVQSGAADSRSAKDTKRALQAAARKVVFFAASWLLLPEKFKTESLVGSLCQDAKPSSELNQSIQEHLGSTDSGPPVRPHRLRRPRMEGEAGWTIADEMESLREEVEALEEEQRWAVAWQVEQERLGDEGIIGKEKGKDGKSARMIEEIRGPAEPPSPSNPASDDNSNNPPTSTPTTSSSKPPTKPTFKAQRSARLARDRPNHHRLVQ